MSGNGNRHATVVASLALLVAVCTGSAWAVGSADIQDDAVLSRHIRDREVRGADVANDTGAGALGSADFGVNALGGADISETTLFNDNSLTGLDVNESSLGTVPSATNADSAVNASALQGLPASAFVTDRASFSSALTRISAAKSVGDIATGFFLGSLSLRIECNSGPDVAPLATTSVNNALIRSRWIVPREGADEVNYREDDDFDAGQQFDLVPGGTTDADDSVLASFVYFNPAATETVTASFLLEETGGGCIIAGTAVRTFIP